MVKKGLILKKKSKVSKDGGFTLIEVIASIAVLAIVSVALLRMFTVSAKTNETAYNVDNAKSLCVDACESYKADPTSDGVFLSSFDTTGEVLGVTTFTKYYSDTWEEVPDITSAKYMLEIEATRTESTPQPISYYPPAAASADINGSVNVKLEKSGSDSCIIEVQGIYPVFDKDNIIYTDSPFTFEKTALIPIQIDCSAITVAAAQEVRVTNYIDYLIPDGYTDHYEAIADIYLCNIPEGSEVDVVSLSGISTENKIVTEHQTINKYDADISVKRVTGEIMAQYKAEKYWVEN